MIKKRVFKFLKGLNDLNRNGEGYCNIIQCGSTRFTLKDFKRQEGHDDSLPYTAIFCVDGKPLCRCVNTGWGEQTEITPLDISCKARMAALSMTLSNYKWTYADGVFPLTIQFIADTLAIGNDIDSGGKGF